MGKRGVKATPIVQQMDGQADKFPMNPDPDLDRIRRILIATFEDASKPFDPASESAWAFRAGQFEGTLKIIAEELGGVL